MPKHQEFLVAGVDGELITWDAAGAPAAVAVGTATHVLTSNGTGAAPTFQAAGSSVNPDHSFYVHLSAAQSIADATSVKVQFNAETYDTDADFDSATNYRHTPSNDGKYLYMAGLTFDPMADGSDMIVIFKKNGAEYTRGQRITAGSGTKNHRPTGAVMAEMNGSTDYMEVFAYQQSGGAENLVTLSNAANVNYFQGARIGT